MIRRYSFFVIFGLLASSLFWWARSASKFEDLAPSPEGLAQGGRAPWIDQRRELLELLDQWVALQNYYRSISGGFSENLAQIGATIPPSLKQAYEFRVVVPSRDSFRLVARSVAADGFQERIEVDQDYRVTSNFPLPPPRAGYLRALAMIHLKKIQGSPGGQVPEPTGIYRDYFRFDARQSDGLGRKTCFAVGVRSPVLGVRLELGPHQESGQVAQGGIEGNEDFEESLMVSTGQRAWGDGVIPSRGVSTQQRAAISPVRILGDLSRIADFREGANRLPAQQAPVRKVSGSALRQERQEVDAQPEGLVIEPIAPVEGR